MNKNKQKAIFFDRDGVVNFRIANDYVKVPEEFNFLPDFLDFFPKVRQAGYLPILITNQQGVGKGIMTESDLKIVHDYMQSELHKLFGFSFTGIFYNTDLAGSGSYHRKPNPGMLIDAINQWNINSLNSWMIGDSPSDSAAGKKAGLKTILIGNYNHHDNPESDYIIKDLFEIEKNVPIL